MTHQTRTIHSLTWADDGYPECSCGSAVEQWHPAHDWDTAMVCRQTSTAIASKGYVDQLAAAREASKTSQGIERLREIEKLIGEAAEGWAIHENSGDPLPHGFRRYNAQRQNEVVVADTLAEFASRLRARMPRLESDNHPYKWSCHHPDNCRGTCQCSPCEETAICCDAPA